MSDVMDPDAIRARSFSVGRRGFERSEVEAFQAEVAAAVGELQSRLDTMNERLTQMGISDLPDLKAEIDTVGEDVREILQAARDAAEDMRDRARADAETRVAEAQAQAESLRGAAWQASEQMLQSVGAAAEEQQAKASEDALFVRAEAEREALRMTGDARRDAEELLRTARAEAKSILESARSEGEAMVEAATQSADLAQERVRALEQRREELMQELEEARETLTELEETIEGKRGQLTHATTDPAESAVRVLTEADKPEIGDWLDDDATVRVIAPPPSMPLGPVDADELAAEVESLRTPSSPAPEPLTGGSGSSAESASLDFEITSGDVPAVADASATAAVFADATPEEVADLPAAPSPAPAVVVAETPAEPEPEPLEDAPVAEIVPEPAAEEDVAGSSDAPGLDDLFASLRSPAGDPETARSSPAVPTITEERAVADPATLEAPDRTETQVSADAGATPVPMETDIGPWDLRTQMLVPVTNDILRSIKREIVDVQNLVLEELRTEADDWRPKKAMFDSVLGQDAHGVAARAYEAGVSASGELTDRDPPQLPVHPTHSLSGLVTDLWEAVVDAIDGTAGGSSRERGASVGRIFRAWRTDEAERRVRQVAYAEYNAGVAAGLEALGLRHTMEPAGRDLADPDATVVPVS